MTAEDELVHFVVERLVKELVPTTVDERNGTTEMKGTWRYDRIGLISCGPRRIVRLFCPSSLCQFLTRADNNAYLVVL